MLSFRRVVASGCITRPFAALAICRALASAQLSYKIPEPLPKLSKKDLTTPVAIVRAGKGMFLAGSTNVHYIRREYVGFFKFVDGSLAKSVAVAGKRLVRDVYVIIGNPGIGKTISLNYVAMRVRQRDPKIWIVANVGNKTKELFTETERWMFSSSTHLVEHLKTATKGTMRDEIWLLHDVKSAAGTTPFAFDDALYDDLKRCARKLVVIVASSPQRSNYAYIKKLDCNDSLEFFQTTYYYLPTWTKEELECLDEDKESVVAVLKNRNEFDAAYDVCGGSLRSLREYALNPGAVLGEQNRASREVTTEQLKQERYVPTITSVLLQLVPTIDRKDVELYAPISSRTAELLRKAICLFTTEELRHAVLFAMQRGLSGCVGGYFDAFMTHVLPGMCLTLKPLEPPLPTTFSKLWVVVKLPSSTVVIEAITDIKTPPSTPTLYLPDGPRFPIVDAALIEPSALLGGAPAVTLFQYTVKDSHPPKPDPLKEMLDHFTTTLGVAADDIRFVWVGFDGHGVQTWQQYKAVKTKSVSEWAKVQQFHASVALANPTSEIMCRDVRTDLKYQISPLATPASTKYVDALVKEFIDPTATPVRIGKSGLFEFN